MLVPVCLLWGTPGFGLNHMHVQNGTEKVYFLEPVRDGAAEVEITQEEPGQYQSSGLPLDPRGIRVHRDGEPIHGAVLQPKGRCKVAFKPRPGERFEATLRLLEMKDFRDGDDTVVETVVAHLTLVVDHRGKTPVTSLRGRRSRDDQRPYFKYFTVFETMVFLPNPERAAHREPTTRSDEPSRAEARRHRRTRPKKLRQLESSGLGCVIL